MNKEQFEEYKEKRLDEICKMIMRQTEYTYEESKERLIKENYDYLKVIKQYITKDTEQIKRPLANETKSVNQKIYNELRGFMDNTAEQYEKRKRKAEKIEEMKKKLSEEYEKIQKEKNENKDSDSKNSDSKNSEV